MADRPTDHGNTNRGTHPHIERDMHAHQKHYENILNKFGDGLTDREMHPFIELDWPIDHL